MPTLRVHPARQVLRPLLLGGEPAPGSLLRRHGRVAGKSLEMMRLRLVAVMRSALKQSTGAVERQPRQNGGRGLGVGGRRTGHSRAHRGRLRVVRRLLMLMLM